MSAAEALRTARAAGIQLEIEGEDLLLEAAFEPPVAVLDVGEHQLERLLRDVCERITERDDGSLSLDSRKGLVQVRQAHGRPAVV